MILCRPVSGLRFVAFCCVLAAFRLRFRARVGCCVLLRVLRCVAHVPRVCCVLVLRFRGCVLRPRFAFGSRVFAFGVCVFFCVCVCVVRFGLRFALRFGAVLGAFLRFGFALWFCVLKLAFAFAFRRAAKVMSLVSEGNAERVFLEFSKSTSEQSFQNGNVWKTFRRKR